MKKYFYNKWNNKLTRFVKLKNNRDLIFTDLQYNHVKILMMTRLIFHPVIQIHKVAHHHNQLTTQSGIIILMTYLNVTLLNIIQIKDAV